MLDKYLNIWTEYLTGPPISSLPQTLRLKDYIYLYTQKIKQQLRTLGFEATYDLNHSQTGRSQVNF